MCENKKHLGPCIFCADKTVIYCRPCVRKHYKKYHKGEKAYAIPATIGDVMVEQKQLRYRCDKCKTYSKSGGACSGCGEKMKRSSKGE